MKWEILFKKNIVVNVQQRIEDSFSICNYNSKTVQEVFYNYASHKLTQIFLYPSIPLLSAANYRTLVGVLLPDPFREMAVH